MKLRLVVCAEDDGDSRDAGRIAAELYLKGECVALERRMDVVIPLLVETVL